MIVLLTAHTGAPRLARHLASDTNERIIVSTSGLASDTLHRGIAELRRMALGSRSRTPLAHAVASPSIQYGEGDWEAFWNEFENEFGFQDQPYVEAVHLKIGAGGRTAEHAHRVYLRVRADRRSIPLPHSYARCEKLGRIAEFRAGERLTCGAHTRAVIAALRREGRASIADAIVRMGHDDRPRPIAVSPRARAQAERLHDMAPDNAGLLAWRAWTQSDDGPSFRAALRSAGLQIAKGDKTVMLVGPHGLAIRMAQALRAPARLEGKPIRKAEVDARIRGVELQALSDLRLRAGVVRAADQVIGVSRRPPEQDKPRLPILLPEEGHRPAGRGPARKNSELPTNELKASQVDPLASTFRKLGPRELEAIERYHQEMEVGLARSIRQESDDIREQARSLSARDPREAMSQASRATQRQELDPREEDLRRRVRHLWSEPTIGAFNWRSDFKARLANVPSRYGAMLRWVEREEASGATYALLKTGELITEREDRVTVDVADPRTAEVMVAYAKSCEWRPIIVSGGSLEWKRSVAYEATRLGLEIANLEMRDLVAEAVAADADVPLPPETDPPWSVTFGP